VSRYVLREAFVTLQGEGAWTGARAVFLRFAGCNLWSGRDEDRARDAAKGGCAAWCDTAFVGTSGERGGRYTGPELIRLAIDLWGDHPTPLVVCTGGEPSLQLDGSLVAGLREAGCRVHVETNGTRLLPPSVDWITLSPKPPATIVRQRYAEVKVVYPAVDPTAYEGLAPLQWVQPLDGPEAQANQAACVRFVHARPSWRLSMQTHKALSIP
jgi:7-carboxy-7-deazaguanine synthase